jgi:hypothetical protein
LHSAAQLRTICVFDKVTFYDGYASVVDSIFVPDDVIMHTNSLYSKKIPDELLMQFGDSILLKVEIFALCDNYDRIGNVNLVFISKGKSHDLSEKTERIELGRFITPFMNKNIEPKSVTYMFHINHLKHILNDKQLIQKYDFWLEFELFGVPYAAQKQVDGCEGRNDVFIGSLNIITFAPQVEIEENNVLMPLAYKHSFNNYDSKSTDEVGKTIKSFDFELKQDISDAQFVLIISNHGANKEGEEYVRRIHHIYFDNNLIFSFKSGRMSCEPFREYNTQNNGIYGKEAKTDEEWQSFSNWCPGDIIDTRIISLGKINKGNHTFRMEVPDAVFAGKEGNFPLSLYFQGKKRGESGDYSLYHKPQ